MNVKEAAAYLHLTASDIETLIQQREIPCTKQGSRVVFRKTELDAWASQRILRLPACKLSDYHAKSSRSVGEFSSEAALMPQLITVDRIQIALTSKTRASVIRDLVDLADVTGLVSDKTELLTMIQEREQLCSTGIPGGLALLHPRYHDPYMFSESFMILGRTIQPIHFGAEDGKPSDLFFLICCQDDRLHLHALARLCTMCQNTDLLTHLRMSETAQIAQDALFNAEAVVLGHL